MGLFQIGGDAGGGGASLPTGMVIDYVGSYDKGSLDYPAGWLPLNGNTIGDGASGATELASSDAEALFKLLWAYWANAQAPVSGGRGASAAADWAAHKTIALPDTRGRVIAGHNDMGNNGGSAGRLSPIGGAAANVDGDIMGFAGGQQNVNVGMSQLPVFTSSFGAANGQSSLQGLSDGSDFGDTETGVVQPTIVMVKLIKL